MAGNIKGITIEFNGETTKLTSALKKVKSETKNLDSELKAVNKSLKFNPGNTELIAQKTQILKDKISAAKQQLQELKNIQSQMDAKGVDKNSSEYRGLRREIIETESKLKHFNQELRNTANAKLNNLKDQFSKVGSSLISAGTKMSVGGAAGVVAGKKLIELSEAQSQAEDKLTEIYKSRMGVNKKAAQSTMELASAIQKQGVVGDEVTLSGAQQLATFSKMPGTVNKLLPAMDNLLVQQKGLNGTQEDAKNIANMFGKAMTGNVGALSKAGITFTDAQKQVLKYGTEEEKAATLAEVVNQNVGNMNEKFAQTDSGKIQQAKNELGDMGERIGATLIPAVADLAKWVADNIMPKVEHLISYLEDHPVIAKTAVVITALLSVCGPLLIMLGGMSNGVSAIIGVVINLKKGLGKLSGAFGVTNLKMLAIIAIIAAVVAAGVWMYKHWDTVKQKAEDLRNMVVGAMKKLRDGVKNAFSKVADIMTKPFRTAWRVISGVVNRLKNAFHFSWHLPKLELPHISVKGGKAPFGIGGKGSLPSFSIKWYRRAMDEPRLLSGATIFGAMGGQLLGGGESGQEVVYGRQNLIDDIREAVGGLGQNLTVNVYGASGQDVSDLADQVVDKIIEMTSRKAAMVH